MTTPAGAGSTRFAGAARASTYTEPATADTTAYTEPATGDTSDAAPVVDPAAADQQDPAPGSVEGTSVPEPEQVQRPTTPQVPVVVPPATWGFRGRLNGIGLKLSAGPAEQAHLGNETTIRQATWTRPMSVLVANEKGGVGKTPTALIVAGVLAMIRGGYVAAVEFTESTGTLTRRSEGNPPRGLAELLANADNVSSAGVLSGYTAPQTSFAHVIGSVQARPELRGNEVYTARRILDRHYHLTVVDTGNNHLADCYKAAVLTADAVVIPVSVTPDGLEGALRTIDWIRQYTDRTTGLHKRITAVITHTGGTELEEFRKALPATLAEICAHVVEVPEDPEIRRGGPITVARLSPQSLRRWTEVAAHVVTDLTQAPEEPLV
jgi:MinD-like ATPase involved in chromosome partitioning or flagellar assembly